MAKLRKQMRLAWNGQPPVTVWTSARDMADLQEADVMSAGMGTFALLHNALKRSGHDVPDLNTWVDQLDEMEELDETPSDPTHRAGSTNGQSPLPSLPVQTSTPG
jgi:hypothetical protein